MAFGNFLADRQSNACSAIFLYRMESLENDEGYLLEIFRTMDANPVILDGKGPFAILLFAETRIHGRAQLLPWNLIALTSRF